MSEDYPTIRIERDGPSVSHWHRHDLQVGRTNIRTGEELPENSLVADYREVLRQALAGYTVPENRVEATSLVEDSWTAYKDLSPPAISFPETTVFAFGHVMDPKVLQYWARREIPENQSSELQMWGIAKVALASKVWQSIVFSSRNGGEPLPQTIPKDEFEDLVSMTSWGMKIEIDQGKPIVKPLTEDSTQFSGPEIEKKYESVLAILLDRQRGGYRRGIDDDGRKVGLTFDMGSYGGIISLAMARKLEVAGLLQYVDGFYGLSSGGVNAAFAAAGQTKEGVDTYLNIMMDKGLIKKGKLFPPRLPKMDLEVLREAITKIHPLKLQKLVGKGAPVVAVGATDLDDPYHRNKLNKTTDLDPDHLEEFIDQLISGCAYPVLNKPHNRKTDAGMSWESAMEMAASDGCTHILSLSNAPPLKNVEAQPVRAKVFDYLISQAGQHYINSQGTKRPPKHSFKRRVFNPVGVFLDDLVGTFSGDATDYGGHDYTRITQARTKHPYIFSENFYAYKGARVERIYPPDVEGLPGLLTPESKNQLRLAIRVGRAATRRPLTEARSALVREQSN